MRLLFLHMRRKLTQWKWHNLTPTAITIIRQLKQPQLTKNQPLTEKQNTYSFQTITTNTNIINQYGIVR